jgi:hypothetical protein
MLKLVAEESGASGDDQYRQALVLERLLCDALSQLGDGGYGRAAADLFGVGPLTKGRLLKDRRRFAADQLGVLPSTFRRNYEPIILRDLAVEVWRMVRST